MKMKLLGLLLFSLCVFFACQKRADQILTPKEKYQKEFADWLHSQKNSFSDEQLLVEKDKIARLNWGAANYFETEKTSFLEVPYAFQAAQNSQSTGLVTNNNQNSSTLFSLVFAKSKQNGTVEARVLLKDKFDKLINGVSVKEVYLFDDLAGKRRRSYFRAAGNTRLTRMYRDDNQANTQVQQIGSTGTVANFCISIQIPVYDLKCNNVNNADPGSSFGYPTTCTYTLVGWANFNSGCAAWQTQSLEPPDTFDYDGFGIGGGGFSNSYEDMLFEALYNCSCDCLVEDEMIDASVAFEPKWGQLGNLATIKLEMNLAFSGVSNNSTISLQSKIDYLRNHFNASRHFIRDSWGNLIDDPSRSKKVDRYVYTNELGWIDMHHFFYAASLSEQYHWLIATSFTSYGEIIQFFRTKESSFSYEDLPSNKAGIDFYLAFKDRLKNNEISINSAVEEFLLSKGITEPSNAPNYHYIPHIQDALFPKNYTVKGLTGEALYQATYTVFCKRDLVTKNNIKNAHKTIKHSSH